MSARIWTFALGALGVPFLGTGAAAAAPVAAKVNASGQASVLSSLSLLKQSDLDFGTLAEASSGTAVLDPLSGALTTTGGVTVLGTGAHVATFIATGSKNSVVHIRIPTSSITLTRVGGGGTMTVSNWTLDGSTNRKVPPSSAFSFAVGATLNVAAAQPEGDYTGTFNVTVQYP